MGSILNRAVHIWQVCLVFLVLCRTPLLRVSHYTALFGKKLIENVWKIASPALISVGPLNAQTGPTEDIELDLAPNFDDASGVVGQFMDVRVFASSNSISPQSYTHVGRLPPGIELTNVNQFGVATYSGTPTEAGRFPIVVTGWEEEEFVGPGSRDLLIIFVIDESGPQIIQQPIPAIANWGESLSLSVSVANPEATSYQWFKDSQPINAENSALLEIPQSTSQDSGNYHVVVTDQNGDTKSDQVLGLVSVNQLQSWQENNFENPFNQMANPDADPDFDNKANSLEFVLGENPFSGQSDGYPKVTYRKEEVGNYLVCEFRSNPFDADVAFQLEMKSDMKQPTWSLVDLGNSGILSEEGVDYYRLILPFDGSAFFRLRQVDQ